MLSFCLSWVLIHSGVAEPAGPPTLVDATQPSELSDLKRQLRAAQRRGDSGAQVALLKDIAILGVGEGPDRCAAHAAVIGAALVEPDAAARIEAARLLPLGLHRDTAVDSLTRAMKEVRDGFKDQRKQAGRGGMKLSTVMKNGVRRPGGEAGELLGFAEAVVDAMKELPDPRNQMALGALLKANAIPGDVQVRAVEVLLHYADQQSLLLVRAWTQDLERGLPRKKGDPEPEVVSGRASISSSMNRDEVYGQMFPPATRRHLDGVRATLRELAVSRNLPAAPAGGEARSWKTWFKEVIPRFAAKIQ